MSSRPLFRSPLSYLAFAGMVVLGAGVIARASERTRENANLPESCVNLTAEECRARLGGEGVSEAAGPAERSAGSRVLLASEVCTNVGYLCAEVEENGNLRLLRWPDETPLIRVWVPEPSGLPPGLAREFQRAAVRGIQSWHGHPFPLSIRTRERGETPDVTVEWARIVEDGRLGHAGMEWSERGGTVQVRILGLVLATHVPGSSQKELSPQQVELVAAHEMGHALGLPHSDNPRDVMFPTNTATRLTTRDFRTLDAIYALPNGAEIRQ